MLVPADGEVLVPVRVEFFPDTPRTPLEVVVDAFDVRYPGNAAARNHVVLRVIHYCARPDGGLSGGTGRSTRVAVAWQGQEGKRLGEEN